MLCSSVRLFRVGGLLLALTLGALASVYLVSLGVHAGLLLSFPYPLDYGEGPLLAQISVLCTGEPIWQLYSDPSAPPYIVVNYPPVYLLLVTALSWVIGSVLLAGRLVSLISALGIFAALALLISGGSKFTRRVSLTAWASALLFLTIPVVREWATLLRVDMLGVCLGLWALLALRRAVTDSLASERFRRWALLAALLFLLSLYTKPSLVAAPAAGFAWLVWIWLHSAADSGRRTVIRSVALWTFSGLLVGGVGVFGGLQQASEGWFALHVVTANANRWDADLAWGFWQQQIRLRWPLAAAAGLGWLLAAWSQRRSEQSAARLNDQQFALPVFYSLFGIVVAVGVGKVGAYANYFLELYAGLVWMIGSAAVVLVGQLHDYSKAVLVGRWGLAVLLLASLLYYPPLWSATLLRPAGLIEPSPPRLALGRYGVWNDLWREAEVLAAQGRVQAALIGEVRDAGSPIFTDMPGVAAEADVTSRMQAFEHRQLFDQGEWDQRLLLRELANGELPLAVLDYLGNWLTPAMIEIIQRRYAHDGSFGTFDLFRPVDPGPCTATDLDVPLSEQAVLSLTGVCLTPPTGANPGEAYDSGELLGVTLEWQVTGIITAPLDVVIRVADDSGRALLEFERPLLYGVFSPADWPEATPIQHMHPIQLPAELPPRAYTLTLTLRQAGRDLAPPHNITRFTAQPRGGRWFGETNYFVPAPFMQAWAELGGIERAGYPLTPAVPFEWGVLQCFERICLEMRDGDVVQRPLGERLYLAETLRSNVCFAGESPADDRQLCDQFLPLWLLYGPTSLGQGISGEIERGGLAVQWTRYARLERSTQGDLGLGRLGDDSLRLPPGVRYRWP